MSATTTIETSYERVIASILDRLAASDELGVDPVGVGVVALSLGGYYGLRAAVHEGRIAALVSVSGVTSLPWYDLPPP